MKNLLKVTAAALLLTTSVAFANDNEENKNKETETFKMSMYFDSSSETIKTFFEKQKGDNLIVKIVDQNGKTLTRTTFGKKQTSTRLNLNISDLPDGTYTLVVDNEKEITKRELTVSTTSPEKVLNY